jgi:thiamine-monophosphate kinase
MRISKIGEFGLIKRVQKLIKTDPSVIKGSGDDCAVIRFDKGHYLLLTCDMLVEGVDFTSQAKPYLIGRKALAVSLSDIAACGGRARYALVALGLPKNSPLSLADGICRGITDLAKEYAVNIVGGDLSRADKIILDVSVFGSVKKKQLVLRSGAAVGDIIFVSGPLGGSIFGKHLTFTPRLKEASFLVNHFHPHAMIDISDGLVQDLRHIAEESKVGALLYEDLIPLSRNARGISDALYSGEDFELLFTMSMKESRKLAEKMPAGFKPIGKVMPKKYGLKIINKHNREIALQEKGYRHF